MTDTGPARARLEQRLLELSSPTGRGASVVRRFATRTRRVLEQLRTIAELLSQGHEFAFSLDLCELIDWASFPLTKEEAASTLAQRRSIVDSAISRRAVEVLRGGTVPYTLLPGSALEILAYLRALHSQFWLDDRLTPYLGAGSVTTELSPEAMRASGSALVSGADPRVVMGTRLMPLIDHLLDGPSFLQPNRFDHAYSDASESLPVFLRALDAVRPRKAGLLSNLADAANLAVAAAVDDRVSPLLIHVTRTSTLHQLADSRVKFDVSMDRLVGPNAEPAPILCRPDLVYFLSLFLPTAGEAGDVYSQAERFASGVEQLLSCLSLIEKGENDAVKEMRKMEILYDELTSSIVELGGDADGFFEYIELFTLSAFESQQFSRGLSEERPQADVDWSSLENRLEEMDALGHIRRCRRLFRVYEGAGRIATVIASNSADQDDWRHGSALFQSIGLNVRRCITRSDGGSVIDYQLISPGMADRPEEEEVLIGVEVLRNGCSTDPSWSVYWPTVYGLPEFETFVRSEILPQVDGAIARMANGSLTSIRGSAATPRKLGEQALHVLQFRHGALVATCEVAMEHRSPLTSVRGAIPLSEFEELAARSYGALAGILDREYLVALLEIVSADQASEANNGTT